VSLEEVHVDEHRPPGTLVKVPGWGDDDVGLFVKTFRVVASFAQTTSSRAELDRLQHEHTSGCDCNYPSNWHHKVLIKGEIQLFETSSYVLVNVG
jgi:hypothetical protein